jgi:uncharacterized protein (TIGR00730 family)
VARRLREERGRLVLPRRRNVLPSSGRLQRSAADEIMGPPPPTRGRSTATRTSFTMKRICVFAGSSSGARDKYRATARELGRTLAQRNVGLIYGGARIGLMGAVADAVLAARGHVTGIIPEALVAKEVAHTGLSELRVVKSMHERKAMMSDLSDGFIALPGGWGTLEEFFEVLTWAQLGLHQKPCALLNVEGYFDRLLAFLGHAIDEGFLQREYAAMIPVSSSPSALLDLMAAYRAPAIEKWIERVET